MTNDSIKRHENLFFTRVLTLRKRDDLAFSRNLQRLEKEFGLDRIVISNTNSNAIQKYI